jgi:hypothetical protein
MSNIAFADDEPPKPWREVAPSLSTLARNLRAANREHATIVTTTDHRAIEPHSGLESKAAYVLLARPDCAALYEQPPRVPYRDYEGILRHHTFDFVMVTYSDRRIAVAVKPTVYADGLVELMKHIVPQLDRKFATGILVLTDLELSPVRVANGKAIHHARRDRNLEHDRMVAHAASTLRGGAVSIHDLIETAGLGGHEQGFYAAVRAIGDGVLQLASSGLIDRAALVRAAKGT